jgi:phosphoribosylamine---glycine ligase
VIMKKANIFIIGSGGREHAIGWKLKQSLLVNKIYFAPGNAGTSALGINIQIDVRNRKSLLEFVKNNNINLTIVGPEAPLAEGIVDIFKKDDLRIFGPTKKAARLEWDKEWAAGFMEKYNIPHPQSYAFKNIDKAKEFIRIIDPKKIVIKACGLAAGKGVFLPGSLKEASETLERIMVEKKFGKAGDTIVFQERLKGAEVSIHAISDGKTILPLLPAQDHKRVFDHDKGPNTGGMGAYAPVPFVTDDMINEITKTILQPTLEGMKNEGIEYTGILYAGLMVTKEGLRVLEYNCRFGDPETQPLMMLLESDIFPILSASVNGTLNKQNIVFRKGVSICVVLAAKGYPGSYLKGVTIQGIDKPYSNNVQVYHAGTSLKDTIVTEGGRVLGVTAVASSFKKARGNAYNAIGKKGIFFKGMHFRKDIGIQAVKTNL